ncbi:MAG TPA: amino acid ABC transporter permease [Thermoplasmata archaeon]|nr:amino acid ABC transporter permease [Thermoplasmata archaeon]
MSDPAGYSGWRRVWHEPFFKTSVGIVALLAVVGLLLTALNNVGEISFDFMASHWSFLLRYATTSLEATVISFAIGFGLAIPMGLVRAFGPGMIRRGGVRGGVASAVYAVVTAYAEVIRGTPALVQLFLIQFWVTSTFQGVAGISLLAGIVALSVNTTGYQTEVFRAGFQSVGQGQIEAAKSIGMRPAQTFASITLPQGLRLITLPLANEWIALFKASSLLWLIAVQELLWGMDYLGTKLNRPIDAFILGSFFYLAILIPLSRAVTFLERVKRIPGLGVAEPQRKALFAARFARLDRV